MLQLIVLLLLTQITFSFQLIWSNSPDCLTPVKIVELPTTQNITSKTVNWNQNIVLKAQSKWLLNNSFDVNYNLNHMQLFGVSSWLFKTVPVSCSNEMSFYCDNGANTMINHNIGCYTPNCDKMLEIVTLPLITTFQSNINYIPNDICLINSSIIIYVNNNYLYFENDELVLEATRTNLCRKCIGLNDQQFYCVVL